MPQRREQVMTSSTIDLVTVSTHDGGSAAGHSFVRRPALASAMWAWTWPRFPVPGDFRQRLHSHEAMLEGR